MSIQASDRQYVDFLIIQTLQAAITQKPHL